MKLQTSLSSLSVVSAIKYFAYILTGLRLNCTNGKDSHVRLRTNFLSITCCAIKGKEIRYFVMNCHLAQLVGLSHVEVWEFKSGRFSLFFPLFLSFFP